MDKFEQLLSENRKTISRVIGARLIGHSCEDIEDIVQEVCLALCEQFEKAPQGIPEDKDKFRKYIIGVAYHKCYDYLRRYYRTIENTEYPPKSESEIQDTSTDLADDVEKQIMIEQTLEKLNPIHSEIIRYRCQEGYSEETTADILGISKGTVKSRLNTARKNFRTEYGSPD